MSALVLDIETISPPMVLSDGLALDHPPRNLRKQETIDRWRNENAGQGWRKLSLDVFRARVACVGWAFDPVTDGQIRVRDAAEFFDWLEWLCAEPKQSATAVVGANILGFDLPILWAEAVRQGRTKAAREIASWTAGKPWERITVDVLDAVKAWGLYGKQAPSLATLCDLLGVPTSKDDIDGSEVLDVWHSGDEGRERVRAYCARDVWATWQCYEQLRAFGKVA